MAILSYAKSVTVDTIALDYTGKGRIGHEVTVNNSNGSTSVVSGKLYLETEYTSWPAEPESVKVTIASAKAIFNGATKVNITSSQSLTDTGDIGAKKSIGTYTVNVTRTHSAQTITYKLTAGTLTTKVTAAGSSKSGTSSCGTKSGTITIPAKPSYSIAYNADGGSGAPGPQTKWYGEAITLSAIKPTKTGYVFEGWATSSGGEVVYQPGSTYTGNAPLNLFARWAEAEYTLTYDANGGTTTEPSSTTRKYNQAYGELPTPTRTGYDYSGWFTEPSGGTEVNENTLMGAADTIIYAQWIEKTATLAYESGGHGTAPASVTMTYTAETIAADALSETGFIFLGWQKSGASELIQPGGVVKEMNVEPEDLTLVAQWTLSKYKITLDEQGATTSGTSEFWGIYSQGFYSDSECTNQINAITPPIKTHYNFNGYYEDTNKCINADGSFAVDSTNFTGNTELDASWESLVYHITLNNQGAAASGTTEYYEKYAVGNYVERDCINVIRFIYLPEKTGYTFKGYYSNNDGTGTQYIDDNGEILQSTIGASVEIYCKWQVNQHTLIYDTNGGDPISATSVNYGSEYGTLPTPERAGYHFDGWYDDLGNAVSEHNIMGDSDVTIYAHWTPKTYSNYDDYDYTVIATGEVAAVAKENSSYGLIPYSITDGNDALIITSLENCFKDDTNVSGDIYVNCSAVNNVDGIFDGVSNDIRLIFGSDFDGFTEVWDNICETYENVTYLGIEDSEYYYTADETDSTNHNLNIRVKDKTKQIYVLPILELSNNWKIATMNECYKDCINLEGILQVNCGFTEYTKTSDEEIIEGKPYFTYNIETEEYNRVQNPVLSEIENYYEQIGYDKIFDGVRHSINIWCLNEEALPIWQYIASLDDNEELEGENNNG